jgi:DNA-directed RNA polymerase specialized sigma24 family protein
MDLFAFDDEYVRRLRDGDPETVQHYLDYFKLPLTHKLRRRRALQIDDIKDIIQSTHLKVFQQLHSKEGIRDSHAFGALVHTTCTHVAQEYERKHRQTFELKDEFVSRDEDALRELITKETKLRVRRVLQSLAAGKDKRDAEILRDLYIKELEKDEICRKHGVDRNYLRVLIHRALKKFREEYDPDDS